MGTYLCSVCKRVVCSDCKEVIDGRVYCLDDIPLGSRATIKYKGEVNRPLGVAIIAILGIIFSIISIVISLFLTAVVSLFSFSGSADSGSILGLGLLSIISLILDFVQFAISYGLWNMKKWALHAQIGLYILNTGLEALQLLFFPPLLIILAIPIYIIYYLSSKRDLFS